MKVNLAEFLSIAIAVLSVISAVWRVAAIEKNIQINMRETNSRLEIFITSYHEQREHQQYLINDLYGQIKHKTDRLISEIKELEIEIKQLKKHD